MQEVKQSKNGIGYLSFNIGHTSSSVTKVFFWQIPHNSGKVEVSLRVGKYGKDSKITWLTDGPICSDPRSVVTLNEEELKELINLVSLHYQPIKQGEKYYIPINEKFDPDSIKHLKAIFDNQDKTSVLNFIAQNQILPDDIVAGLEYRKKINAISEFEKMLTEDLVENEWQGWFKENDWVLGSEFVRILDERDIDTQNIADYLMQAYDGFLDIIEIKRPFKDLKFWHIHKDHDNYIPSIDLMKAITQATKYIHEVELQANDKKFFERLGYVKTIKPRCVLIFGRSNDWEEKQREAYRILNSSYHNLTILTYDHVLKRAKRILGEDIK